MSASKFFEEGDGVVTRQGRIGVVVHLAAERVSVTFGAGGPVRSYRPSTLRFCTEAEVEAQGLHGVGMTIKGCRQRDGICDDPPPAA